MAGSKEAVELATHLPEIGFPEFTTKLVSDVFDSLIASNLRQTEAYVELLKQTGKTLKDFCIACYEASIGYRDEKPRIISFGAFKFIYLTHLLPHIETEIPKRMQESLYQALFRGSYWTTE